LAFGRKFGSVESIRLNHITEIISTIGPRHANIVKGFNRAKNSGTFRFFYRKIFNEKRNLKHGLEKKAIKIFPETVIRENLWILEVRNLYESSRFSDL